MDLKTRNLSYCILPFLAYALFSCSHVIKAGSKCSDFEVARNAIVHIGVQESGSSEYKWLGTGFVIDSECTFATAKHVLDKANPENIIVRFQLPEYRNKVRTIKARILYEHNEKDLAFLKIDTFNDKPCRTGGLQILNIFENETMEGLTGKEVFIIGHPSITKSNIDIPIFRHGVIASTEITANGDMILLDLQGVPGFSGSPVILKETGEVIGTVFGPGPTKRIFGFEWATQITKNDYKQAMHSSK